MSQVHKAIQFNHRRLHKGQNYDMSPVVERSFVSQTTRQMIKRRHSAQTTAQACSSTLVAQARTISHNAPLNPSFTPRQRSTSYTGTVKGPKSRPYPRSLSPVFPHFSSRSLQTMVNTSSPVSPPPGNGRSIRYALAPRPGRVRN